jgi:hypothetical protein
MCLLPIAQDYTMIEAAVVECAFAGCDTIWIVCNDDISPLVRYRVGDFIQDPIYFYNNYGPDPAHNRIRIPIIGSLFTQKIGTREIVYLGILFKGHCLH